MRHAEPSPRAPRIVAGDECRVSIDSRGVRGQLVRIEPVSQRSRSRLMRLARRPTRPSTSLLAGCSWLTWNAPPLPLPRPTRRPARGESNHIAFLGSGSNAEAEADTFWRLEDLWQSHRGTSATHQTSGQHALRAPELSVHPGGESGGLSLVSCKRWDRRGAHDVLARRIFISAARALRRRPAASEHGR